MLKIKTWHLLNPFRATFGDGKPLELSPVVSEDNELIQAIEQAAEYDAWNLSPVPDTEQLHKFWTTVQDDIANDPEWVWFQEE